MPGFKCPFCNQIMAEDNQTHEVRLIGFKTSDCHSPELLSRCTDEFFAIDQHKCPNCGKVTIKYYGMKGPDKGVVRNIYPCSNFIRFPDYIPQQIRSDYEEACSIVDLSPKASATLSRRCLQGMIHDFWRIHKENLAKEIEDLQGKIPADQWKVINGLRRLGNIGAHMEKDVSIIVDIEPDEAQKLIKLIELLLTDWYINRHEQQQLYTEILNIDTKKQEQRKANGSSTP